MPAPAALVILLHGVHADGANLAPLAEHLRRALPGAAVVAPDAPFATPFGFQWFSLEGVTPENRPERIFSARDAFDAVLRKIVAAHGLEKNLRRVALVGFSQGSMMALDAFVSGRWPVGGLVAFSGRLASPPPFAPPRDTPVALVHGDDNSVISCSESREAAKALQALGVETRLRILPGVDHCIDAEGANLAAAYLRERFAGLPPTA